MDEKEFDFINVIPFIDIMLVLLTIVLTTSTLIVQGVIPLQLPQVSHVQDHTLKTLAIDVNREGEVFLAGRPVSMEDLITQLKGHDRKTPILIRADRAMILQIFVNVLDTVKHMGFSEISLQTEAKS